MQHQTKLASFVEACTNTLVGLALAFLINAFLMAATGVHATAAQNAIIVLGHTVVSVIRGYVVRRVFNAERWKAWWPTIKRRLFCKHEKWFVRSIEWDGVTEIECVECGKTRRRGL